ncbi:MAG: MFS transporter [Burkholderiales bacterium]|nr:MFS transporter [Burkholderiales bacterium]
MSLSRREKAAYGAGDFASGLLWQSIGLFLMFFYTEVYGLPAAAAGGILFVARAWDAVWDLLLGYAVDRTHSRWGRCRPYLLFGPPLLAAAAIATFTVPNLAGDAKLAYAYASYIGLMMAYSLVNIPYSSMPALMSSDPAERNTLTGYRMFAAFSGWLVVAGATLPLVQWLGGEDKALGYRATIACMAAIAVAIFWACFANTRERMQTPVEPPDLLRESATLLRSPAWWTLFAAGLIQFTAVALPNTAAMYFLKYVAGHVEWASSYFVLGNVGMICGVLVSHQFTKRWCKRSVVMATTAASASCLLLLLVIDPQSRWELSLWYFTVSALGAIKAPIIWSMVADTIDLVELQSGRRVAGLITSSVAFANKFGLGVGGGLAGAVLGWVGYQAGAVQSATAQQGITWMISVLPAAGYLMLAGAYWLYPINRPRLDRLQLDLARRREQATIAP